jgi:DNA-directed RNA polymerase specialized sigma24 family protein
VVYEVNHCSECGKPIKSVPAWLATVDVRFNCDSCRQKHPRPFAPVDVVSPSISVADPDSDEPTDIIEGDGATSLDDLLEEELAEEEAAIEKAPED